MRALQRGPPLSIAPLTALANPESRGKSSPGAVKRIMNRLVPVLFGAVAIATGWLYLRQERLACQVEMLRADNTRLNLALAAKPDLTKEEFNAVSRRLETAEAFMNAVEGRLTNASMLLTQLQLAAKQWTAKPATTVTVEHRLPRRLATTLTEEVQPLSSPPPLPKTPVSSHSPTGELLARSWGPEQVVGPPNTFDAGDYPTAWAPSSSQGGRDEWLQVNYDRAVEISEVRVHETYNPGAVARLVAMGPGGGETVIWEGVMPPGQAPVESAFAVPPGTQTRAVRIYFDRTRAPGWNEIDAVELVARDGSRQWASSAVASSSYADR